MRTKQYIWFFITLFTISFYSCHQTEYVDIQEELVPIYNFGDTVIMKSNFGNYDTLVCEFKYGYYEGTIYGVPPEESDTAYYTISSDWNKYYINVSHSLSVLSLFDCSEKKFHKLDTLIVIDTIKEINVFVNFCQDTCDIKKEFYSAKYGLLEYHLRTGKIYKIYKYIGHPD
ncbi:MAG: hypothetical protein JXR36_15040 [Bacteroidales bacterium]|nr:hypothetical protein [Bacteroidales bacterium]